MIYRGGSGSEAPRQKMDTFVVKDETRMSPTRESTSWHTFQNSSGRTSRPKNWFSVLEDPKMTLNTYVINRKFFWHGGSSYEICKNSSEELLDLQKFCFTNFWIEKVLKSHMWPIRSFFDMVMTSSFFFLTQEGKIRYPLPKIFLVSIESQSFSSKSC